MVEFILSYAEGVIGMINLEWFQYCFFTMIGVAAVSFINYLVWGK